jgi:multidrug efflux system membrane fusion protein
MLGRSVAVAAALFAAGAVSGCGRSQGAPPPNAPKKGIPVRIAPVAVQDVVYRIQAVGSLEAEELVQITAEVEGAVSEVLFNEGDRVDPRRELVRIDPDRYRLEAERADASYKQALAERDRALADLKRREELGREQLVAIEELNRARGESERLAAEADAARAARDLAQQNLRKAHVRPPQRGVINSKTIETGRFVQNGTVLGTLVDTRRLKLRFKVSEAESLRARKSQTVRFRVTPLGERDFEATVYHVSDVADPATRQVEVLAWVTNPGELKPGFFAEVTLASETRAGALVVPEGAVQASERGFVAYAVVDGKAKLKPVQIGLRTGTGVVEILSGLSAGEQVVVEGSDRLADGAAVSPVPSAAASGSPVEPSGAPSGAGSGGRR